MLNITYSEVRYDLSEASEDAYIIWYVHVLGLGQTKQTFKKQSLSVPLPGKPGLFLSEEFLGKLENLSSQWCTSIPWLFCRPDMWHPYCGLLELFSSVLVNVALIPLWKQQSKFSVTGLHVQWYASTWGCGDVAVSMCDTSVQPLKSVPDPKMIRVVHIILA